MSGELQRVEALAGALRSEGVASPRVVLVLGSGLHPVEEVLAGGLEIPYTALPGVPTPAVAGHSGKVLYGRAEGVDLLMLCGRIHLYEGHTPAEVVRLLRAALRLGAKTAVITNAAGGVNPDFGPGELMVLGDHINLQGCNPFAGPVEEELGPRFPDQSRVYDPQVSAALLAAAPPGKPLREGVYLGNPGPLYETPAEVRMAAALGADAVGMSTVQEAAAAAAMGARVGGVSVIANRAAGISDIPLDHGDVVAVVGRSAAALAGVLRAALPALAVLD